MIRFRYKIQEILQASTQVVSGQLIRVKAKVILSDCEKGNKKSIEQCGEKANEASTICHFKIWDQPWIPKGRETNITCENEQKSYSYRSKRSAGKRNWKLACFSKNTMLARQKCTIGRGHHV